MRTIAAVCALVIGIYGGVAVQAPSAAARDLQSWHDYNNDSIPDLAIGIPGETVNGQAGAGAVEVLYGGPNNVGLRSTGSQFFNEGLLTTTDGPSAGDAFGSALASGDFDADGYSDLAIGIPGEDIVFPSSTGMEYGAIVVLWGSATGLVEDTSVSTFKGGRTSAGVGKALVALDIIDATDTEPTAVDNIADLAIAEGDGRVIVEPGGSRQFLSVAGRRLLNVQMTDPTRQLVLAQGNIDGDFPAELLLGMPGARKQVGNAVVDGAGALLIINRVAGNSPGGLSAQLFFQEDVGFASEAGDNFGASFATGQLTGSGLFNEELVVGAPGQDVTFEGISRDQAGMAFLFMSGVTATGMITITEKSAGVPDNPEPGDRFAQRIAIGHFRDDNVDDIAYGVPGEMIGNVDGAGAVIIEYRNFSNVYQLISQNTTGVPGAIGANDKFGNALAAGNFNRDEVTDLAIGVPLDNEPSGVNNSGTVNVIYSDGTSFAPRPGDVLWSQATAGVSGSPGPADKFGFALR